MNEMMLVFKSKVIEANEELKALETDESYHSAIRAEGFRRGLTILGLADYDPVKEQQEIEKIYNRFHGEEDDLK